MFCQYAPWFTLQQLIASSASYFFMMLGLIPLKGFTSNHAVGGANELALVSYGLLFIVGPIALGASGPSARCTVA